MAEAHSRVLVEVPPRTFVKIGVAVILAWCLWQLSGMILLLVVAVVLAAALNGPVCWIQQRGLSRTVATLTVAGIVAVTTIVFLLSTWSMLTSQWEFLSARLTTVARDAKEYVPLWIYSSARARDNDWFAGLQSTAIGFAQSSVTALTLIVLGFFVTIYLLIEGRQTIQWFVAFFPTRHRPRLEQTLAESHDVIRAYVRGNMITSLFATIWVLAWLTVLGVPAALLLAVIAGIADFVPVLGFIASVLPAALLALTVSPRAALAVLALYITYHVIENYFIGPWAYGRRLRLSELAVILAFVAGATLAGVIGAIIALPMAALYPTIERIWLREQLPPETVPEHRALTQGRQSRAG
jgi:putative heme transporter